MGVVLVAVSGCAGETAATVHPSGRDVVAQQPPGPGPEAVARREERALPAARRQRLDRALARYLDQRPGRVAVAVYDRTTSTRYAFREREPFMLASVAKMDILLALLLRAQEERRGLDGYERTLASRMIRYSDNDCAHELYMTVGGRRGLTEVLHRVGAQHTRPGGGLYWGTTRSRPSDQVRVLEWLTDPGGPVSAANRRYALDLMSTVHPAQDWGVGAVGGQVAVKNGWLPAEEHDGRWTVNSVGRLTVTGHELLVAVLSERSPAMSTGVATVEQVARLAVRAFAGQHG